MKLVEKKVIGDLSGMHLFVFQKQISFWISSTKCHLIYFNLNMIIIFKILPLLIIKKNLKKLLITIWSIESFCRIFFELGKYVQTPHVFLIHGLSIFINNEKKYYRLCPYSHSEQTGKWILKLGRGPRKSSIFLFTFCRHSPK